VDGCGQYSFDLLRLKDFLVSRFKYTGAKTKRAKHAASKPDSFEYSELLAKQLLDFTIVLVYSTISPIITLCGVLYFALAYVGCKYNLVFVNKTEYEGVRMTRPAINIMTIALIIYHLTTLGALGLKGFPPAAGIVALPILTLVFRWYLWTRFDRPFVYLALMECPHDEEIEAIEELSELFLDPALILPEKLEDVDFSSQNPLTLSSLPHSVRKGSIHEDGLELKE